MFLLLDAGKEPQILLKTNQRAKKAMQQKQEQPAVSYWVTGQENMLQNSRASFHRLFTPQTPLVHMCQGCSSLVHGTSTARITSAPREKQN